MPGVLFERGLERGDGVAVDAGAFGVVFGKGLDDEARDLPAPALHRLPAALETFETRGARSVFGDCEAGALRRALHPALGSGKSGAAEHREANVRAHAKTPDAHRVTRASELGDGHDADAEIEVERTAGDRLHAAE